jgi:organic radical activating enzyme
MAFVEIKSAQPVRQVEIRLGNYCNYDCSFCDDNFKSGTKRALDIEAYKQTIDNLMEGNDIPTLFIVQGGEPTLYPKIVEFLSYIKQRGGYTQMFSNGSRTMRWWEEFLPLKLLDRLVISHHAEQHADPNHTAAILNMAKSSLNEVSCSVTIAKNVFTKSYEHFQIIRASTTDNIAVIMSPVILPDAYDFHNGTYSDEELDIIKNNNKKFTTAQSGYVTNTFFGARAINDRGISYPRSGSQMQQLQENKFNGWECDAGIYRLVIETDDALRAMCRVGGVVGKVSNGTAKFLTSPVTCNVDDCYCGADAIIPKRKTARTF